MPARRFLRPQCRVAMRSSRAPRLSASVSSISPILPRLVCNVRKPGERPRLPAGFVPARTPKTPGVQRNAKNGRFRCCLVCGDCHATLYDPCCRSNDLLQRVRYTCADFHSNCHTAPYGSCNSAHFDDHQLHDVLQFAGRQLSNSLSYPRPVGVWNHDIERHGKYSVFVNLL